MSWDRVALLGLSEVHGQGVVIYLYRNEKRKKHHLPHLSLTFNKGTIKRNSWATEMLYLKASNLFPILHNQLLQLLKLLVSLVMLLLACVLYCHTFLKNSIFFNDSIKLFLV
jgi:hypothetical protein